MPKKKSVLQKKWEKMTGKAEPTEQEEKKAQAKALRTREQLLARMEQVRFVCSNDKLSQEFMDNQHMQFRSLMNTLDNLKTANAMDMQMFNTVMVKLCDDLQQAYTDGDKVSAEYIMMAFEYGIRVGHKPLLESEKAKMDIVVESRQETMKDYDELCARAIDLFKEQKAVKDLTKRMRELGQSYTTEMEKLLDYMSKHEGLHEEIVSLGGKLDQMNSAQFKLAMMEQKVLRLDQSIEQVLIKEGIHQGKINALESALDTLYTKVMDYNNLLQDELVEFINNLSEKETIRLTQGIIQIDDLNTATKNLHNVYMNAFRSSRVQQMMVSTAIEFEELRARYESQRDSFGRSIYNEDIQKVNEHEYDQEIYN